MLFGGCAGVVEGVLEAGIEGTETEFIDLVREVECCDARQITFNMRIEEDSAYRCGPGAGQTPGSHDRVQ